MSEQQLQNGTQTDGLTNMVLVHIIFINLSPTVYSIKLPYREINQNIEELYKHFLRKKGVNYPLSDNLHYYLIRISKSRLKHGFILYTRHRKWGF